MNNHLHEQLLVSVIVPCHNATRYIADCLDSVINQTHKSWELMVIDDGSSDDSAQIVKSYATKDKRVKLLSLKENFGAAIARNKGIAEAQGRYIAFLDADDIWLPHKLERQIEFMQQQNLYFTYSSYNLIDKDNNNLGVFHTKPTVNYTNMLQGSVLGCSTVMYDAEKLGKQYMPNIPKRQDYVLWLKIIKKNGSAQGILEPLTAYRILKNSLSANKVQAARYQWKVYRTVEKLSLLQSVYYFIHYACNGFFKYK